jgi:hypothetical protein
MVVALMLGLGYSIVGLTQLAIPRYQRNAAVNIPIGAAFLLGVTIIDLAYRVHLMAYRNKDLNVGNIVTVVFCNDADAIGRLAPIIAVERGSLLDRYVLAMDPPLPNGNKAIVIPEIHVKML